MLLKANAAGKLFTRKGRRYCETKPYMWSKTKFSVIGKRCSLNSRSHLYFSLSVLVFINSLYANCIHFISFHLIAARFDEGF